MQTIELNGVNRVGTGKKVAKLLRQEELVPCVLYGAGEVVHFSAHVNEFRYLVYSTNVYIVNLNIDGKTVQAI
ncbi:MAG: 50S ribosomal protein L25, partial [Breznakibacter sp.]|nr:50S ribosomal protein L25 [Breznakibacter sp.]